MNLLNPMTTIGKMTKPFEHPYKGIVVQVDQDPNYIGRIKVNIPELFGEYVENADGNTAGILPWIYPRYFGKFSGLIDFEIPEKGDVVEVDFPYQNVYLGYYTNKPIDKSIWDKISQMDASSENPEGPTIANLFKSHYPEVYGHIDRNLTGWYVDKSTNEIFIVQGGNKCKIWFAPDGALNVTSPTNIIFNAGQSIIMNSGTSIEMSTQSIAGACTDYSMQTSTMDTVGTLTHSGAITTDSTVTAAGEGTFNGVTVSKHIHKVPQAPSGVLDSQSPTSGT